MSKYEITVSGCDDSTTVELELTDAERDTIQRVAREITAASNYGCMPTMRLRQKEGRSDG